MKRVLPLTLAGLVATSMLWHIDEVRACAVQGKQMGTQAFHALTARLNKDWGSSRDNKRGRKPSNVGPMAGPMPLLPEFPAIAGLMPWGGPNPTHWRAEAIMANAASHALNDAWKRPGTVDAIVAIPVNILPSGERPYGDGQTNAAASFNTWNLPEPPLVATLAKVQGAQDRVVFRMRTELFTGDRIMRIAYFLPRPNDATSFDPKIDFVNLAEESPGSRMLLGVWLVPQGKDWGDVYGSGNRVAFVQAKGRNDWFPVDFRHPIFTGQQLMQSLGPQGMSGNRSMYDPEGVTEQVRAVGVPPVVKLANKGKAGQMGPGFNQVPFTPKTIHAWFPDGGQSVMLTSVGYGLTWVADKPEFGPFKTVYTCFEKRRPDLEDEGLPQLAKDTESDPAQADQLRGRKVHVAGSVPSGGGWHEIGDPAETIINNLEPAPVVVGMGTAFPAGPTPPPDTGMYAFGITDVATIRWLRPGEALVTPAGDQTLREDNSPNRSARNGFGPHLQRNYHWFFFQHDRDVCTQEWVHPCVPRPGNSLGLRCGGPGFNNGFR